MKIHHSLLHVNVTRTLNLSQISLLLAFSFHASKAPPFLKLRLSASHCHIDFFDAVVLKPGAMRYGLIDITDWIFYFSDETKKKFECKKKKKKKMDGKRQ